ncbi:MAG: hypothetical protein KKA54_20025 [Proteobacteria bacterium]|nr:hypothetical protein [Pseudomonadota bacterium]
MKRIYFVTEGPTDQIVIEGLIDYWLGGEDFIPRYIQPPSSAYADGLDTNLSDGWKGVRDWCVGKRMGGPAGRDEALKQADCLIVHIDADVATDPDFKTPLFKGPCPPAKNACDWIRNHLTSLLGGEFLPPNVVLCVPSQDLETWVLCALHPEVADENLPIECRENPGMLLVQRRPHRLVRRKGGRLRKETAKYKNSLLAIVKGWVHCTAGVSSRCPEAIRFEGDTKHTLGIINE